MPAPHAQSLLFVAFLHVTFSKNFGPLKTFGFFLVGRSALETAAPSLPAWPGGIKWVYGHKAGRGIPEAQHAQYPGLGSLFRGIPGNLWALNLPKNPDDQHHKSLTLIANNGHKSALSIERDGLCGH